MQVLIYKTELKGLAPNHVLRGLVPGDPVELKMEAAGVIGVYIIRKARFWIGKPRRTRLGALNEQSSTLLDPVVRNGSYLRVRIVEVQPAHLVADGRPKLAVSVWGNVSDFSDKWRGNPAVS